MYFQYLTVNYIIMINILQCLLAILKTVNKMFSLYDGFDDNYIYYISIVKVAFFLCFIGREHIT